MSIYRFDYLNGSRKFIRQLRPDDMTGMDSLSEVFITPDGKYYVYGGKRGEYAIHGEWFEVATVPLGFLQRFTENLFESDSWPH